MTSRVVLSACVALGLSLGALGCQASSPHMAPGARSTIDAAHDQATVVFIRPAYYASSVKVTIVDEKGRYLGESLPESYFTVKMPPGEHLIVGFTDTTHALKANLVAGKIYYVHVVANEDNWSPRFSLLGITPRSKDYGHIDDWMAKASAFAPDEKGGQEMLAKHHVDAEILKGQAAIQHYDAKELEERTILPDDGKIGTTPSATAPPSSGAPAPVPEAAPSTPAATP